MFGSLMGSLIDSEGIVTGKIQQTLSDLADELNEPDHKNFFITIKPLDSEDFEFVCEVFHRGEAGIYRVREITIKEIVDK